MVAKGSIAKSAKACYRRRWYGSARLVLALLSLCMPPMNAWAVQNLTANSFAFDNPALAAGTAVIIDLVCAT